MVDENSIRKIIVLIQEELAGIVQKKKSAIQATIFLVIVLVCFLAFMTHRVVIMVGLGSGTVGYILLFVMTIMLVVLYGILIVRGVRLSFQWKQLEKDYAERIRDFKQLDQELRELECNRFHAETEEK